MGKSPRTACGAAGWCRRIITEAAWCIQKKLEVSISCTPHTLVNLKVSLCSSTCTPWRTEGGFLRMKTLRGGFRWFGQKQPWSCWAGDPLKNPPRSSCSHVSCWKRGQTFLWLQAPFGIQVNQNEWEASFEGCRCPEVR